jgi:hypothetical protein
VAVAPRGGGETPESAAEFVTRLFCELPALFKDEDELRALWSQPDTRRALLDSLAEKGYGDEQLGAIKRMIDAEKAICSTCSPISRLRWRRSRGGNGWKRTGRRYSRSTTQSFRRCLILFCRNT